MNHPTLVALLAILVLWSLIGVIWYQKRRPQFDAAMPSAGWAIAKAGPIVWVFLLVDKLRR